MIRPYSAPDAYCARSAQSAQYALLRQQRAVQRVLLARDAEETAVAARWARAWHRLVQQQLAAAMAASIQPSQPAYHGLTRRQLH